MGPISSHPSFLTALWAVGQQQLWNNKGSVAEKRSEGRGREMSLKHSWGRGLRTNAFAVGWSKLRSWNLRERCFPEGITKKLGETGNTVSVEVSLQPQEECLFPLGLLDLGTGSAFRAATLLCRMFGSVSFVAGTGTALQRSPTSTERAAFDAVLVTHPRPWPGRRVCYLRTSMGWWLFRGVVIATCQRERLLLIICS